MKVKITYPVITFNVIEQEMTEDEFDELKSRTQEDLAKYIIALDEKLPLPNMLPSQKNIEAALDVDYATIKAVY